MGEVSSITKPIQRWCKREKIYCRKLHVAERSGLPDLILCVEGIFVALEVKRPKKDATLIQQEELKEITRSGGYATVVRSLEEAKQVVSSIRSKKLSCLPQSEPTMSSVQPPRVRSLSTCASPTNSQ